MNVFEMRGFSVGQLDGPREHLSLCAKLRRDILARPRCARDMAELLSIELDRTRLAHALGADAQRLAGIRRSAALAACMTVRERLHEGDVELVSAEGETLVFPPGESGAAVPVWLDGLACAVLAGDDAACTYMGTIAALDAVCAAGERQGRALGAEPFWREYGLAYVALLQGRPIAAAHAQRAREQIVSGQTGALVRESLASTDVPLLALIEIVAAGAREHWREALQRALDRFHVYHSAAERAHSLSGYLPLLIASVVRIAIERGFPSPGTSPYLPAAMLTAAPEPGDALGTGTRLHVRFPLRSVLGAEEAHWYLDLQGCSRNGRRHRLLERDGCLLVRYELDARNGLPPMTAEFSLIEVPEDANAPLALDAGQLLFLAEAFASQCEASPRAGETAQMRTLLSDAVACLDAVLARIPAEQDAVPPSSMRSTVGHELLQAEPGRLRRTRLAAYRAAMRDRLAATAPAQGASAERELDALIASAQRSIELIREQALPMLEALARDAEGSVVARLLPRDDDFSKVFTADAAERARRAYGPVWSRGLRISRPRPSQTEIQCALAPAGMLSWPNELSHGFPGGYRGIASMLNPHRIWLAWKYVQPGHASGLSFDGLVWVDDHWAWFPKPYRYLAAD